jgi:hypothetical protein
MVPNMNPAQLVSHYDAASNGPINYISLLSSIQIGFDGLIIYAGNPVV